MTQSTYKTHLRLKHYYRNGLRLLSLGFIAVFAIVATLYLIDIFFWFFGTNRNLPNPLENLAYIEALIISLMMMSAARIPYTWFINESAIALAWLALLAFSSASYTLLF